MSIFTKLKEKRAAAVARHEGKPVPGGNEAENSAEKTADKKPDAKTETEVKATAPANPAPRSEEVLPRGYRQACSWETAQVELYQKSEAKAWRCAKLVSVISMLLVAAIVFMMPLKQTVPFVIQVDKSTGMSEVLEIANRRSIPADELMDKYWLSEYVKARETYDWRTIDLEYSRVREMSMPNIFEDYAKYHGDTPGTMEMQLRDSKVIRIEFVSIIPAGRGIATVRFIRKVLTTQGFKEEGREYLQATIGYEYDPTYIVSERRRIINPFGFKVTSYRVDQELRS